VCTREQQTKMDEYRKRLETLLLDPEDFELIVRLAKISNKFALWPPM
jgi:hypothetical protein